MEQVFVLQVKNEKNQLKETESSEQIFFHRCRSTESYRNVFFKWIPVQHLKVDILFEHLQRHNHLLIRKTPENNINPIDKFEEWE